MRDRSMFVILGVLAVAVLGCATPTHPPTTNSQDAGLEVRIYEVFGMDCPGCHGGLEKLVLRIPAVHAAEANWERKRLTVTLRAGEDLDDADVHEAIRQANFTPGERLR